ncbi:MAG TPA: hypothetical protein PKA63_02080 [Oligoflexia bacterium]|nr:hypothetical protein [Oligoflexia bacterium]HMP47439.1 hypothetical protein [Oligoflexia bacterium]
MKRESFSYFTFTLFIVFTCLAGEVFAQVGSGPTGSFTEASLDDSLIRNAVGNLFRLIEGAFGALIMVVAGILAIIAAAMGGYRAALGMLIVALGAFILRALVSLFFGADFEAFQI